MLIFKKCKNGLVAGGFAPSYKLFFLIVALSKNIRSLPGVQDIK